ncbi:MAG TPA: efflux RND transporter periplasmic adaptor subunit [Symbiobacteriaceae bacterium]|nr:efflux RND transporter periplasmic adaptor subunit [Symbiobacteriaceae bacterium]
MKSIKAMTAALLLLSVSLTAGCGLLPKEEEEPAPQLAAPVKSEKQTYTVRKGSIEEKVSLRAIWTPVNAQDLFYKNGGRVKAVYVRSGDKVAAGQVLAELFADDAEYQLAQARIRLEKVKLSIADAQFKYQFNRTPAIESELKRQELDLKSAEMDVERWDRQLAETRLTAPFDGIITSVNLKVGDNVGAYALVMRIEDPTSLWIEADADESQLAKLAVGQKVRLEFSDVKDATSGTVVQLPDPLAKAKDPANAKKVKVQPDKTSVLAKMSMAGKVHIILQEKKDVLLLDTAAIRKYANRTYVTMKEPRREVDVTVGIEDENVSEVVKGLKEGDVVVGR